MCTAFSSRVLRDREWQRWMRQVVLRCVRSVALLLVADGMLVQAHDAMEAALRAWLVAAPKDERRAGSGGETGANRAGGGGRAAVELPRRVLSGAGIAGG